MKCEKELAYLTSPLPVYFLHTDNKNYCSIRLDNISLSGKFHAELHRTVLHSNKWRQTKELDKRPLQFKLDRIDKNGEIKKNIATLTRNKHQYNSWRLETSNHIQNNQEKKQIINVLKCFSNTHITRLDLAFDFINWKHAGMNYLLNKPNTATKIFRDRAGKIQTIIIGSRKSRIQYRYYDKLKEQKSQNKDVPSIISNWERLEIQIRNDKIKVWYDETLKMLNYFKRPNLTSIAETDTKTYYMLQGMLHDPNHINKLSKRTVAKYRKLYKNNYGFDASLAETARKVLIKNKTKIENEIASFLIKKD